MEFDHVFIERWVSPFYLLILHANYTNEPPGARDEFNRKVRAALAEFTPDVASRLIGGYWREALSGSWFAGLARLQECKTQIGERLVASEQCFAGQGHAFAMARYGDSVAAQFLTDYLHVYLRKLDCYYDQHWALPALLWIDRRNGTNLAAQFLEPNGLWHAFAADNRFDLSSLETRFGSIMRYCEDNFDNSAA